MDPGGGLPYHREYHPPTTLDLALSYIAYIFWSAALAKPVATAADTGSDDVGVSSTHAEAANRDGVDSVTTAFAECA